MSDLRIRINDLPEERTPAVIDNIAIDGPTTRRTSLQAMASAVRPYSTEGQAREGHDNASSMTPIRVAQAIETLGGSRFATSQQGNKADTAAQKSDLASVALSGNYHDLKDLPDLGSAAAKDVSAFATAEQGKKADTALQPQSLGALARKDKIAIADIDTKSAPSEKLFLSGDGSWKEPPGGGGISGGKVDGDLNVSGEMKVNSIISDQAVTGFVIEVFNWEDDGHNGRQRYVTGGMQKGGDLFGEVWGKKNEYGKLSDYLKARLPKTFAVVDKDNKVVSIADGLENIEVSGMRVVGIAEERDFDAQMPPIGYDTALAEETGASVDVSGNVEIQPPLNPYLPDLSNWRLHAAIDLEKGLRDRFNAAITRMPAPKRAVSRAKLARKPVFQRSDPLFEELIADPKFGMTKDQFDTFWKNALILN